MKNSDARYDLLTGLLNRRAMDEAATSFFGGTLARRCVVALWDVDGVHAINSSHGHAAGDQVIRCVADRLRATIGAAGVIGRCGGDEFAVLLPDMDRGKGKPLLEAAWRAIRASLGSLSLQVTASCGAVSTVQVTNWTDLLTRADMALYKAKREHLGVHFPPDDGSA